MDLCPTDQVGITERLKVYALHNQPKLRALLEAINPETEVLAEPNVAAGSLLFYYYFTDWLESPDFAERLEDEEYLCSSAF